jgi:hypothetical protein
MILRIEITKQLNGSGVLQCARNDGSVTWQSKHAEHFSLHDLTHYAIETALGFTEADILMYAHTPRRLLHDWFAIAPGQKLELTFDLPSRCRCRPDKARPDPSRTAISD